MAEQIDGSFTQLFKKVTAGGGPASNYYLKLYNIANSPISMFSDKDGGGALAKCRINDSGYPLNGSGQTFVPFATQTYKVAMYISEEDADANDFLLADFYHGPYDLLSAGNGGGGGTERVLDNLTDTSLLDDELNVALFASTVSESSFNYKGLECVKFDASNFQIFHYPGSSTPSFESGLNKTTLVSSYDDNDVFIRSDGNLDLECQDDLVITGFRDASLVVPGHLTIGVESGPDAKVMSLVNASSLGGIILNIRNVGLVIAYNETFENDEPVFKLLKDASGGAATTDEFMIFERDSHIAKIQMDENGGLEFSPVASDYRLKGQKNRLGGTLGKIANVPVYSGERFSNYTGKKPPQQSVMNNVYFLAHELKKEFPDLVNGELDAKDVIGKPEYQTVEWGTKKELYLWAGLVDAAEEIQELKNINAQMQASVENLIENTVTKQEISLDMSRRKKETNKINSELFELKNIVENLGSSEEGSLFEITERIITLEQRAGIESPEEEEEPPGGFN